MRQRKFKFLLVALLVASGLLFAGGEARANFSSFCYRVDNTIIVNDASGSGDFSYHFSPLNNCSSNTSVKNVLFEIPADVPLNTLVTMYKTGLGGYLSLNCTALAAGAGDPDTRLGVGDPRYRVLTCTSPTSGGFPRDYWVKLALTNINVPGKKLGYSLQVVQLKAGNSLSDSDVTNLPSLTDQPTPPPPVMNGFSANPNPVQRIEGNSRSTCTTLSWDATFASGDSGAVSISGGGVTHTGGAIDNTEVCPSFTTTYTATATSASPSGGSDTLKTTVTVNQPVAPGNFSEFKATPSSITSGEQPLCVTLSWAGPTGTVAISAGGETLASGLPANGTFSVCPTVTTEYTATASNTGGTTSAIATVSVNEPVIQTSCMQILKVSKTLGVPTCLNVCFEIGGEKRLISADLYPNATCEPGTGIPLAIFGPDVAFEPYRVSALQCSPCDRPNGPNGEVAPACPADSDYSPGKEPPFVLSIPSTVTNESTYKLMCNKIVKEYEPSGFTLDLGADPTYFNGSRWVTYSCPPGYRDTGTTCVKIQ